jgi:ubiquinone/menaquinone biosynthesis C-methylase UbiE
MQVQVDDRVVAEQKAVNSHFAEWAAEWAEIYERQGVNAFFYRERLRIVLEMASRLGLPAQTSVLEVGCGAGFATLALARMGYAVHAVDPVPQMIAATRERVKRAGQEHRVLSSLGDVRTLCFPDQTFGLVIAMGVLDWVSPIEQPLREMRRVLRPEGYLIVTVGNRWGLRKLMEPLTNPMLRPAKELAKRLLRRRPRARPRGISLRRCDALFAVVGLKKMDSLTFGFGPFSIFGREFLPSSVGLKLHCRLQAAADRGFPVLRSSGSCYIALLRKCDG